MKKYIPIILIFSIEIFFSISSIVGYSYEGKESSPIYIIYNILIFITMSFILIKNLFNKRNKFNKGLEILVIIIPFILVTLYLISSLIGGINYISTMRFIYYILWGIPYTYMGIYINKKSLYYELSKILEILMVIFTLAIVIGSIESIVSGTKATIGGASYQGFSYIAAFAFGINIYYMFFGNNHIRHKYTKSLIYKILCIIFLVIQGLGVIISGGRGGMILIFIYILYIKISLWHSRSRKGIIKYLLLIIVAVILLIIMLPKISNIAIVKDSMGRIFSYIGDGGINWEGTSERNILYEDAINLIFKSPILGYGIFSMWNVVNIYPHNIILEVLLQGGIMYLFVFLNILIILIMKLFKIIKVDSGFRIISIIGLYPVTLLMFSGTYLNNSLFWFTFSIILTYKFVKK